jgi:NAD dependent epimerase/dehydratase family enzyme
MKDLVPLPKIIIAGGTGFLGQLLAQSLLRDGFDVVLLSRNLSQRTILGRLVLWNGESIDDWIEELEGSRALINLTGRSIDCRHTALNRQEILDSRIKSTRVLGEALQQCKRPPTVWLNASSMALYGQCVGDEEAHDESSPITKSGFLEEVTVAWEDELFKFNNPNIRKVALRISLF